MKIVNRKQDYLGFILILGIGLIIFTHYLRDTQVSSNLSFFLGVAPNFIAAFCCPVVFLVYIKHVQKLFCKLSDFQWFFSSILITLIGLFFWELRQLHLDKFTFDTYDIIASFIGSICFLGCWPLIKPFIAQPNKQIN